MGILNKNFKFFKQIGFFSTLQNKMKYFSKFKYFYLTSTAYYKNKNKNQRTFLAHSLPPCGWARQVWGVSARITRLPLFSLTPSLYPLPLSLSSSLSSSSCTRLPHSTCKTSHSTCKTSQGTLASLAFSKKLPATYGDLEQKISKFSK